MFEVVLCQRDAQGRKTDKRISCKNQRAAVIGAFYFRNVVLAEQKQKPAK